MSFVRCHVIIRLMVWISWTFVNGIIALLTTGHNSFAPTDIPEWSLTHPHAPYCSAPSHFTSGYGLWDCTFSRPIPAVTTITDMPFSHTTIHICLRHVPNCFFGRASGSWAAFPERWAIGCRSCDQKKVIVKATVYEFVFYLAQLSGRHLRAWGQERVCRLSQVVRWRLCDCWTCGESEGGGGRAGGELTWLPVRTCSRQEFTRSAHTTNSSGQEQGSLWRLERIRSLCFGGCRQECDRYRWCCSD